MVDYNCRKLFHCHFVVEVDIGLHHNRVQMHSLVVVLPGRLLSTRRHNNNINFEVQQNS